MGGNPGKIKRRGRNEVKLQKTREAEKKTEEYKQMK